MPNKSLRKRLTPLIRKSQPYNKRTASKGIWVEPELLAEIEYRAKSAEGEVRHPFFKGLREDLGAAFKKDNLIAGMHRSSRPLAEWRAGGTIHSS